MSFFARFNIISTGLVNYLIIFQNALTMQYSEVKIFQKFYGEEWKPLPDPITIGHGSDGQVTKNNN